MPIEELQEPYWEKQKGETPNQYCYFLEFLDYPTNNLKQFHEYLCKKYENEQKGTKVPAYKTIRNWAREACNSWVLRKQSKRQSEKQDILDTLHELDKQDAIANFETKKKIKKDLLERICIDMSIGQPLSQINQGIQALKILHEDDLLDQEEPTEYSKSDVNADIEAKTEVETKAEIAQDIILKPEYVELTRKLLEDVVNDS
jgi:hypothetical protein